MTAILSREQRKIARHALGLPNDRRRSYRNFYLANATSRACGEMEVMVALGLARVTNGHTCANLIGFALTRQGAEAALEPDETLCPENFPLAVPA